jgi:hypothetical protein
MTTILRFKRAFADNSGNSEFWLNSENIIMKFFMSSESDSRYDDFEESLRKIHNEIEKQVKNALEGNDYGNDIEQFGIIPIIIKFDEQMEKDGWFKDRVLFKRKKKEADLRLRINYDKFVKGNEETRKLLLIDNIIKSIEALSKKAKDFKAEKLSNDILQLFNVKKEDLTAL